MADDELPREVQDLVRMAQRNVVEVIGIEPDLTPETLPLVDEYLRRVPADASDEVQHLVLCAVGAYFGEVARRRLNGRWTLRGSHPADWRIELVCCFLHFSPFGMVGEVLAGAESAEHDGSFATLEELRDALSAMLGSVPPVPEDEYYSLCGRIDILQLVTDWLVAQMVASGKEKRSYSAEDYSLELDEVGPP